MILIEADLPHGALLSPPSHDPVAAIAAAKAIMYSAETPYCEVAGSGVTCLNPVGIGPSASPADGNTDGCRLDAFRSAPCLALTPRQASGFVSEASIPMKQASIAAIFFAPEGDAKTIAAICPADNRDYFFLSEEGGIVELGKRNSDVRVKTAASGITETPQLVLAHISDDLLLSVGDVPPKKAVSEHPFQSAEYDLFVGCRRRRAGLLNAQGAARIFEITFLPDINIFSDEYQELRTAFITRLKKVKEHAV